MNLFPLHGHKQSGQDQLFGQSWTLDAPCRHSLEQGSHSARAGKQANRQSVVAYKRKLNTSQDPKHLTEVPLQQSNTLTTGYLQ